MLKVLQLPEMGLKGINSDLPEHSLPIEFLTEGNNFKASNGTIKNAPVGVVWAAPPANVSASHLMFLTSAVNKNWLYCGDSVYLTNGEIWTDVSTGSYSGQSGHIWSGGMLGKLGIINNSSFYPEYIDDSLGSPTLTALQWDAGNTWQAQGNQAKIIRAYKTFLIALNMTESGTEFPFVYRWSDTADINGLPPTWDPADLSGLAGRAQIPGDSGELIDGHTLRDSFALYARNGIHMLDYTGDEFVFRRREISSTAGLIGSNCIAEVNGLHLFLADGDIIVNDGAKPRSLVNNVLKKRITANMNTSAYGRSFVYKNTIENEIGFCVPEGSSDYPNVAYIYNWVDQSWSIIDIDEATHGAYGRKFESGQTYNDLSGDYTFPGFSYGSREFTPLDNTVAFIRQSDGKVIVPDTASSGRRSYVERLSFPLEGHDKVTTITRVYPHIKGSQAVKVQFGSQDHVGSAVRWKPAVDFQPGQDRKVDLRTTGELHCWRIEAEDSGPWEFSGMTIEYENAGLR